MNYKTLDYNYSKVTPVYKKNWKCDCLVKGKYVISFSTDSICDVLDWIDDITIEFSGKDLKFTVTNS